MSKMSFFEPSLTERKNSTFWCYETELVVLRAHEHNKKSFQNASFYLFIFAWIGLFLFLTVYNEGYETFKLTYVHA
jgi:hypothetical protein